MTKREIFEAKKRELRLLQDTNEWANQEPDTVKKAKQLDQELEQLDLEIMSNKQRFRHGIEEDLAEERKSPVRKFRESVEAEVEGERGNKPGE